MNKAVVVLICLVVVLVLVAGLRSINATVNGTIVVDELSQRAKEFVEAQRRDTASSWQSKQLEPTDQLPVKVPSTLQETPCFSLEITLPIRSVYPREQTDCVVMARLTSPAAKLTVSVQPFAGTLREYADVNMRAVMTDTYQPAVFETDSFTDSTTFTDSQGVSFFALSSGQLIAVIFSETNDREKILAESLPKILEALMVY